MILLDTTVLIDALRGRPVVDRLRELGGRRVALATSAVNVEEVVRGIRRGEEKAVADLVGGLDVIAVDATVAWQAGDWRRDFGSRGITLSQADCLVASAAASRGAALATGNPKDFPMAGLDVQHWPAGA